ncbi:SAM-dependent methyltransferase [Pseudomonas sp. gcc21]|uniref:methyltransferase n=1 Tax=Pseudomonas sp. gcc21 TaxID=2726989 RepID=UPI00145169C1|nr:methyltransferase [Pseudomonas sp. gcc21]QJD60356.1 SAM-dependent methyltransferase [Pseudomonas sp. gcc21]
MSWYEKDTLTALQAKEQAQKLAFAPIAFQAARSLDELGILTELDGASDGLDAAAIAARCGVSEYGVAVLLDMGLSAQIVTQDSERRYHLARLGHFLLHDGMTRANMGFTADVCYRAMSHLSEAIRSGTPAGLKELGDWPTIYEGLSRLPAEIRQSWLDFDHFYSDRAFPRLLKKVLGERPAHLIDIGGNTGKWALQCCAHDEQVQVTIVDLPGQIDLAMNNAHAAGYADRIHGHPLDILDLRQPLPTHGDVWWMSQFLDCFSPMEILGILRRVRTAMPADASVYILEMFWDCQDFEAAAYSLNATSLYFTCLANGNSRFYRSDEFLDIVREAGFSVAEQVNGIGLGHTLLRLVAA